MAHATWFQPAVEISLERHYSDGGLGWMSWMAEFTETNDTIYYFSKTDLINLFLKQYNKLYTKPLYISVNNYTRNTEDLTIINEILRPTNENTIKFITKTSISGRRINELITRATANSELYTFEELQNVSLYLQRDRTNAIRVFKRSNIYDNNVSYLIIGTNHMSREALYTALGLAPVWFPDILTGLNNEHKQAIINLCDSIGKMDADLFEACINKCFKLIPETPEEEINFTGISKLFHINFETQKSNLVTKISNLDSAINSILSKYEQYLQERRETKLKLQTLLTQEDVDDTQAIADAKTFKSIVYYNTEANMHYFIIRSKMMLDSTSVIQRILAPENTRAHEMYHLTSPNKRRLAKELFIDNTLQIDFCTKFTKESDRAYPSVSKPNKSIHNRNTIPNPHLIYYNCYGGNKKLLAEAHNAENLQYYLGLLTACNSNLNTGDAVVFTKFMYDLFVTYVQKPILYDVATKTYISPLERMHSYNETV